MIPYSFNPMGIDAVQELSDLDILRQIRDANPTSQLPALWLDSEDPYTQWEGVTWSIDNLHVVEMEIIDLNLTSLENVNKLTYLTYLNFTNNSISNIDVTNLVNLDELTCARNLLSSLDVSTLVNLVTLNCSDNNISTLDLNGLIKLTDLACQGNILSELTLNNPNNLNIFLLRNNALNELPTLTYKNTITIYDFTLNNFPTSELDRFRALGFTDESKLLPQNP